MDRRAAVVTAAGFGDGLMMMVASHALQKKGYEVITFNRHLESLLEWFPGHEIIATPPPDDLIAYLEDFDLIILQNDNSDKSRAIINGYQKGRLSNLSIFYPSYEPQKHPPLTGWDSVFHPDLPMVESIGNSICKLLDLETTCYDNGLVAPARFQSGKYQNRIVIHPTSTTPLRTYSRNKFLKLAKRLKKMDFEVALTVSPAEWIYWQKFRSLGIAVPFFESLSNLAGYVYESHAMIGNESGISHLASNLGLHTVVISGNARRIQQWRPGWRMGSVVTPPEWVPNIKGLRLRDNQWQYFIPVKSVLATFRDFPS